MEAEAFVFSFMVLAISVTIIMTRWFYLRARHAERMAMIEKDIPFEMEEGHRLWQRLWLRVGFLALGIGAGIFAGFFVSEVIGMNEEVAFPALIFLMAGIAIVLSYVVEIRVINHGS